MKDEGKRNFVIFSVLMVILVIAILFFTSGIWVPQLILIWTEICRVSIEVLGLILAVFMFVMFFVIPVVSGVKLSRWLVRLYPDISFGKHILFSVAPAFVCTFGVVWLNVLVITFMDWTLNVPISVLAYIAAAAFYISYMIGAAPNTNKSNESDGL